MRVMGSLPRSATATEAEAVCTLRCSVAPRDVWLLSLSPTLAWQDRFLSLLCPYLVPWEEHRLGKLQRQARLWLLAAAGPDLLPHLQDKREACHLHVGAEMVFLAQLS